MIDPILRENMHLIDSYTFITSQLTTIDSAKISQVDFSDKGKVNTFRNMIYGVGPTVYDALVTDFLVTGSYNESTALSFGEQLYTARGS